MQSMLKLILPWLLLSPWILNLHENFIANRSLNRRNQKPAMMCAHEWEMARFFWNPTLQWQWLLETSVYSYWLLYRQNYCCHNLKMCVCVCGDHDMTHANARYEIVLKQLLNNNTRCVCNPCITASVTRHCQSSQTFDDTQGLVLTEHNQGISCSRRS